MKVKPIFAWYDIWVGFFWDREKRRLHVFPVPMFGVQIQFSDAERERADYLNGVSGEPPVDC